MPMTVSRNRTWTSLKRKRLKKDDEPITAFRKENLQGNVEIRKLGGNLIMRTWQVKVGVTEVSL